MTNEGRAVPDRASGPVRSLSDYDVCQCGDYRHQHRDGAGACNLRELCRPGRCLKFRLFRIAKEQSK